MGKTALVILGVIVLFLLIVGGSALGSYNTLVTKENQVKTQWSQVENQMQRRSDLIPNLVETVKGVAGQEQAVFGKIAEARARLLSAGTPEQKIAADQQLSQAVRESGLLPGTGGGILGPGGRFLSVTEAYPQLRSNENFTRLQDELAGTENRMSQERRVYNETANDYNTYRQKFPTVLIAGLMGFQNKPLFTADEGARQAPKVKF
jgi:LemA protein